MRGSAWQARQGLAPGVGLPGRGGPLSRSGSPGALPALEARGLQAYAAQRRKGRAENRRLDWRDRWDFTLNRNDSVPLPANLLFSSSLHGQKPTAMQLEFRTEWCPKIAAQQRLKAQKQRSP
jgi:hypothetical protein